jgi:hypothetical protein
LLRFNLVAFREKLSAVFGFFDRFDKLRNNPMKHDQCSPGYYLPVYSPEKIRTASPDYIVVLGWQHQNRIIEEHKLTHKGQWIIPLPPSYRKRMSRVCRYLKLLFVFRDDSMLAHQTSYPISTKNDYIHHFLCVHFYFD